MPAEALVSRAESYGFLQSFTFLVKHGSPPPPRAVGRPGSPLTHWPEREMLATAYRALASRAFNIDSLAVGVTEDPDFSRITFVVNGDDHVLDQVRKQLEKIVTVVKVLNFSNRNYVERELMLIKVSTNSGITSGTGNGSRGEIRELVEIFRGKIVDVSPGHVMVEISGQERKLESFIDLVRPYGIIEMVRTGRVALLRADQEEEPDEEAESDPAEASE